MSLLAGFAGLRAFDNPPSLNVAIVELAGAAPLAPAPLRRVVAAMLTDQRFSPDHLLIAADAIAEAALESAFEGEAARFRVACLMKLVDRLRGAAPTRGWDARA